MDRIKEMEIELQGLQDIHDTAFGILHGEAYGDGPADMGIVERAQKEMDRVWPKIKKLERDLGITQQKWTGD